MTATEKLDLLKIMLGIAPSDTSDDDLLTAYLTSARDEILAWRYGYTADYNSEEPTITDVPREYEQVQIAAVVAGYSIRGNEGQIAGSENGISRTWAHSDMTGYIRKHVIPIVGVM